MKPNQSQRQSWKLVTAAVEQHRKTLTLTEQELNATRPLLASGAVSDIDVLRLERAGA